MTALCPALRGRLARVAGVAAALALAAGCSPGAQSVPQADNPGGAVHQGGNDHDGYRGAGLPDPYPLPSVQLTDTAGEPFDLVADTTRAVTLVFFGYTNCPDICNLVMADIASAMTRLEPEIAEQVQMVFITSDPKRDTPEVIRAYLDRFDPSFEGVTGPLSRIEKVAQSLGVPIEGTRRLPSGGYEVGHGSQIIGIGADDRAQVVWTQGTSVGDLVTDITRLVEQQQG
ncbi:MAG TPA: SCO family protein [Nocardioidaceae bacterium]|nr:SCO family protein [Nocardioidaceae bacterium]